VSVDELAAETISARFGPKRRTLGFVGAGHSGSARGGAEAEQLLEEGGFGIDSSDRRPPWVARFLPSGLILTIGSLGAGE